MIASSFMTEPVYAYSASAVLLGRTQEPGAVSATRTLAGGLAPQQRRQQPAAHVFDSALVSESQSRSPCGPVPHLRSLAHRFFIIMGTDCD